MRENRAGKDARSDLAITELHVPGGVSRLATQCLPGPHCSHRGSRSIAGAAEHGLVSVSVLTRVLGRELRRCTSACVCMCVCLRVSVCV